MAKKRMVWKKGRGKLGVMSPLLGTWRAVADSPMGRVVCTRTFTAILDGAYIQLDADWKFARGGYRELAIFGADEDRGVSFWSFTSDGKTSHGKLADVSDIHPQALGFEAQMPSGLARMAYWPDETEGLRWVVEAKMKKGWRRFTEHHYSSK